MSLIRGFLLFVGCCLLAVALASCQPATDGNGGNGGNGDGGNLVIRITQPENGTEVSGLVTIAWEIEGSIPPEVILKLEINGYRVPEVDPATSSSYIWDATEEDGSVMIIVAAYTQQYERITYDAIGITVRG